MASRAARWLLFGGALLALAGCHRHKVYVERLGVMPELLSSQVAGVSAADWADRLEREVRALPDFVVLKKGEKAPDSAASYELTLLPAVDVEPDAAHAYALLVIRRVVHEDGERFNVMVARDLPPKAQPPELRAALETALHEVLADARLQIADFDRSDRALIAELSSKNAQARIFALRVLTERKNAAAVPGLIDQLSSEDLDAVRAAIGGLVQFKDPRVVPAIIDAAHGRPPAFQRELLYALGEIGGDEAKAYLYTVSEGADQAQVREAAKRALDELSQPPARDGGS